MESVRLLQLREKLEALISQNKSLTSSEVLELSRKLDKVIVKLMSTPPPS